MSDTTLLIGSLSNDLMRVASLYQRGSTQAACRFLDESKRWIQELREQQLKEYVAKIVADVSRLQNNDLTQEKAEDLLMYSVLLQNYTLHNKR